MHCQGGGCSWGTSVPRCCPLLIPVGHQMFLSEGHAVPRSVSESLPRGSDQRRKSCFGTTWPVGTLLLPPLCRLHVSSGLATPPYPRALPTSHPAALGAGLRLSLCGQGSARPPGSQAGLGSGANWCHPEGCRSQSMRQLSQPRAVQLSAEWTLPCISLIHSFSLPKSLRRLLQCAQQVSSAPCRARPAAGSRLSLGQGGWRLSPVPRSLLLLTQELQALHGPWGGHTWAPCSRPLSIVVFALAKSTWSTSVRMMGGGWSGRIRRGAVSTGL